MHDSEDVIIRMNCIVSNYLIPAWMLYRSCFPMALPLPAFYSLDYADEFAETIPKLLLVREMIGGFVPSAVWVPLLQKRLLNYLRWKMKRKSSPRFADRRLLNWGCA
jgi:hypothetical protein